MEAFLQTLLTMSATAAVVALVVMVLRLPLKKVPRWVTCALWGVVLLRMVLPAGLSLPVSLVPQGVSSGAYVEQVLPAAPAEAAPADPVPADPAQQTETPTQTPAQQTALAARLEKTAAAHQMVLVIRQDGGEAGRFGQGAATDQPGLTQALAALEGSGTVSDGTTDLFGAVYSAGGVTYQLEVYSQGVVTDLPHQTEHLAATLLAAAVVIVLAAVLVTNRFLTRFVFRHIQEPLETLAEGVHQIRDGNLTHRIAYDSRDEFQPVCEDFNDMAQRLRASVEQSQRAEASRKELLASISHDIRSPLTAIQAYVEGLLDGVADTPEKQREYLTILQAKATEMDQLVRKIFLFSKMDLGEYPYSPEPLDPAQEVEAVVAASREAYRQRGLSITVEPLPTGCQVLADPIYFHSILTNLLDNSAKYKDKATGQVTITGAVEGKDFCLTVDDDGPGVPPESLPRLFDVFYRNDPARKNPDQGSGLGLAIVAKSMERMGGTIRAENRPQGGLRMVLRIPQTEGEMDHETHSDR